MRVSGNQKEPQRIVVLNPKGGCGKTTIATNLASWYSMRGEMPTLFDFDPQGASMHWLEKRSAQRPPIHGVAAFRNSISVTRTWEQRVPLETRRVIVDTPAGVEGSRIHDLIYDASNLLIPVLPSPIDIRYAARFIAELLLVSQLDRQQVKVGIVANRTRKNTNSLHQLMRFLNSLKIPVVAILRDSQNFVNAAGEGIGIAELPKHKSVLDRAQIVPLIRWLDTWQPQRDVHDSIPASIDTDRSTGQSLH